MADSIWNPGSGTTASGGSSKGSSNIWNPGGGGASAKGKTKKKQGLGGRILSGLNPVNIGKDVLGTAGELISLPQQLVFGTANIAGELARGNLEGAGEAAKHVGREAITIGQSRDNWDFARALGTYKGGKATPKKLPKGINLGATAVLDPANLLGVGVGSEARAGIKALGKLTGLGKAEVKQQIRQVGTKEFLSGGVKESLESQVKQNLAANAPKYSKIVAKKGEDAAEKWAAKKAAKISKAVEERGMGGIHFHVPGTRTTTNIIQGKTLAKGGKGVATGAKAAGRILEKTPLIGEGIEGVRRVAGPVSEWAGKAFLPGKELTKRYGEEVSQQVRSLRSSRIAKQEARQQNLISELSNAAKAVENTVGRKLTVEEDSAILRGLQGGKKVRDEIVEAAPHLAPIMKTAERVRSKTTAAQLLAGVLKHTAGDDTYARRLITPEAQEALFKTAGGVDRLASQVAGSLSGSLAQRSAKARKLFPGMPDAVANQMLAEVHAAVEAGETAASAAARVVEDPKFDEWIGAKQKAKAEAVLEKNVEAIKAQPVTEKSAAAWKAEAENFFKDADEKVQTALDDGLEEVEIGGNTYLTPKTNVEKETLYNYINTLKSGQNISPDYHGMGLHNMFLDVQSTHLPKEMNDAIQVLKGNASQASKQPHYDALYQWIEQNPQKYQDYKSALIQGMKDMGYEDEIFVFRGFKHSNTPGPYSNVSITFDIAKVFGAPGTLPRIYRAKLADVVHGMAGPFGTENELVWKTADLQQIHPDELKFLRTKKKIAAPATPKKQWDQLSPNDTITDQGVHFKVVTADADGVMVRDADGNLSHYTLDDIKDHFGEQVPIVKPKMTEVEKAVIQAEADDLVALGKQAELHAAQIVKSGAVTKEQLQAQISAAFQLALQNSDTTGLKKILSGQLEYIAQALPPGSKLYEESAMMSLLAKGNESARAIEAANYINDLRALSVPGTGEKILISEADWKKMPAATRPSGMKAKEYPVVGTLYADDVLHSEMEQMFSTLIADDSIGKFDKAMSGWERFWKTHATVGLLGALPFGMRNLRSNGWLMVAGGMAPQDIVKYSKQAQQFQARVAKIMKKGKFADDVAEHGLDKVMRDQLGGQDYRIWRQAQDRGIVTQGFFDFDFDDTLAHKIRELGIDVPKEKIRAGRRAGRYLFSSKGELAQKGRRLNQYFEHNSRMAVFLHEIERHGDFARASDKVKEVLFDYSDLTPFEQKKMKKLIAFYTFMRKNVPLQFRTLAESPQRIVLPEKARQLYSEDLPEDAPDYQKQAGARVVRKGIPFLGGRVVTPDRPFGSAVEQVSAPLLAVQGRGKEAARALANVPSGARLGLLKTAIEQGTGTDIFTGNKISPDEGFLQRLLQGQVPSTGRLPRAEVKGVSPARALTGKAPRPSAEELLKLLTGVAARQPTQQVAKKGSGSKAGSGSKSIWNP